MTEFQIGFLALARTGLTEEALELPADLDYAYVYRVAEAQQLVPLIYYGALQDPRFLASRAASLFMERSCAYISHSAEQEELVEQISEAFSRHGLDHMPLKGTLLKKLYPAPEMRVMGDADILIRTEDYPQIRRVMEELNLHVGKESDHEYNWYSAGLLQVELHKRLIPSYNEDYFAYYGDGWQLAHPLTENPHRFEMSPEDTMIYMFTHFAKHYRDSGVGMKYVIDFFVYRRAHPDMDEKYLRRELEKLQLDEFYDNVMHLLEVWFGGRASDEMSDFLTDKMFRDGVFGRSEISEVSAGLKTSKTGKGTRARRKWRLLFPTYRQMCYRHEVLHKWPILLPVFWILRIFDVLLHHRGRARRSLDRIDRVTDGSISAYERELNYVGLDFNFGDDAGSEPPDKASSEAPRGTDTETV